MTTEAQAPQCPEAVILDGKHVLQCAVRGSHEEHRSKPFPVLSGSGETDVTATWTIPATPMDECVPPW